MLGPKPGVVGIAEEFRQLSDSGVLAMEGGDILCEPVICLDFATFRGVTRKRGKCSAICACSGLASLQSYQVMMASQTSQWVTPLPTSTKHRPLLSHGVGMAHLSWSWNLFRLPPISFLRGGTLRGMGHDLARGVRRRCVRLPVSSLPSPRGWLPCELVWPVVSRVIGRLQRKSLI